MNIALFFVGLFLIGTLFLSPLGIILVIVSLVNNKPVEVRQQVIEEPIEYGNSMNKYEEELLNSLR